MPNDTIRKLAQQLDSAMQTLNELREAAECDAFPFVSVDAARRHRTALDVAQRILTHRRLRSKHFKGHQIFGEPAWDILLDLYIQQARNVSVSVKSVTIGAATPATTVSRWLSVLQTEGLLDMSDDPTDLGRKLVRLTPEGYESMTRYFSAIDG